MINFDDIAKENLKEHNSNWRKNSSLFIHNINN